MRGEVDKQSQQELNPNAELIKQLENQLKDALKLESQSNGDSIQYLVQFLSSLVDVLDMNDEQLEELLSFTAPAIVENPEDEDLPEDQRAVVAVEQSCDILEMTNNPHLRALCHAPDKRAELLSLLTHGIVAQYKPYAELMLLLGYHQLHNSFEGSVDFVHQEITEAGEESCPKDFEVLQSHCNLREKLREIIEQMALLLKESKENPEVQRLKNEIQVRESELQTVRREKDNVTNAQKMMEAFKNHLEFLALKGQCFDTVDGKFSYTLCALESVKQKDSADTSNEVNLGQFESMEESAEFGHSYVMHFTNGQHCHAFGARKADVSVVCGEKNVLKSAREPSTCFYTFQFESPAACSEKYAVANGLSA